MYTRLEEYLAIKQILEEELVKIGTLVNNSCINIESFNYGDLYNKSLEEVSNMLYQIKVHEYLLQKQLKVIAIIEALKGTLDKVYGYTEVVEDGKTTVVYDLIGPRRTKEEVNYLGDNGSLAFKQFNNSYNYYDLLGGIALNKFSNGQIPVTINKEDLDEQKAIEEVFMLDNLTQEKKVYYAVLIKYLIRMFIIENQVQAIQYVKQGK